MLSSFVFIVILLIIVATIFEHKLRVEGYLIEKSKQSVDKNNPQKHELDYMNNNKGDLDEQDCAEMNAMEVNKQPHRELTQMEKFLLCFSLETNMKTLLNCDKDSEVCK